MIRNNLFLFKSVNCRENIFVHHLLQIMFVSNSSMVEGPPLQYYDPYPKQPEYFPFFRPFDFYRSGMERNEDFMVPSSPNSSQVMILQRVIGINKRFYYLIISLIPSLLMLIDPYIFVGFKNLFNFFKIQDMFHDTMVYV